MTASIVRRLDAVELRSRWVEEAVGYYDWLLGTAEPGAAARGVRPVEAVDAHGFVPVFAVEDVPRALRNSGVDREQGGAVVAEHAGITYVRDLDGVETGLVETTAASRSVDGAANCDYSALRLDVATEFYSGLLGAWPAEVFDDEYAMRLLVADRDVAAGVFELHGVAGFDRRPFWIVYFEVENVQETTVRALESGSRLRVPPATSPYNTYAILEDPWGAMFGVSTVAPERVATVTVQMNGAKVGLGTLVDLVPTAV